MADFGDNQVNPPRDVIDEVEQYYQDTFDLESMSPEQADMVEKEAMQNGILLQDLYDSGVLVPTDDWDGEPYPWRRQ